MLLMKCRVEEQESKGEETWMHPGKPDNGFKKLSAICNFLKTHRLALFR